MPNSFDSKLSLRSLYHTINLIISSATNAGTNSAGSHLLSVGFGLMVGLLVNRQVDWRAQFNIICDLFRLLLSRLHKKPAIPVGNTTFGGVAIGLAGFRRLDKVDKIWPQRLLETDTLTSWEQERRDDGSLAYGSNIVSPEYNIMSYTWGRYRIDGGKGIDIRGATWKIPAVSCFSPDNFRQAIQKAGEGSGWIWMDVACIDQYDRSIQIQEIGRQAGIFARATKAFVWLWSFKTADLQATVNKMIEILEESRYQNAEVQPEDQERLLNLIRDPWFSSVWTLQEAFLRKDAVIMSLEGGIPTVVDPLTGGGKDLTLSWLISTCIALTTCPYGYRSGVGRDFEHGIKISGFLELQSKNAMALLAASTWRKCSRRVDRIFGIMQVFNLHVEPSDSDALTYERMELKLARSINQNCPALAQTFVHLSPCKTTPAWQFNLAEVLEAGHTASEEGPSSEKDTSLFIPSIFNDIDESEVFVERALLSFEQRLPRFNGYIFELRKVDECWRLACRDSPRLSELSHRNSLEISIFLDEGSAISSAAKHVPGLKFGKECTYPHVRPKELLACLMEGRNLSVLLLGKIFDGSTRVSAFMGVIVTHVKSDVFERVGFCTWPSHIDGMEKREYWLQ